MPLVDETGHFSYLDLTFNQDYMAWVTQGDIAKRELEKLGEGDKGIILFRKLLAQQIELLQDGGEPMNVFRNADENTGLEYPVIPHESGEWVGAPFGDNFKYRPSEGGYSRDADKIEATMRTWENVDRSKVDWRGIGTPAGPVAATGLGIKTQEVAGVRKDGRPPHVGEAFHPRRLACSHAAREKRDWIGRLRVPATS